MTITPSIKRDYLSKLAENGKRVDGRKFDEYRNIEIETGIISKAEGSARVKIGNTQVIAGIKMDIGEPYPDAPESGVMTTAAELIPLASPDFESGPPQADAIELARVVDRGIRESELTTSSMMRPSTEARRIPVSPPKVIQLPSGDQSGCQPGAILRGSPPSAETVHTSMGLVRLE